MTETVDPSLVRFLLHAAERLGVGRDELVDDEMRVALEEDDADRRLPYAWLHRLWTRLVARRPDEPLGVRVAEAVAPSLLGAVGYLVAHSPTTGDALRRFVRFQRIADPRSTWSFVDRRPSARLVLRVDPWVSELRHPVETLIGAVVVVAGALHPDARAERVELAHPPPERASNAEAVRALFGAEVCWRAAENALVFSDSALELAPPFADPRLGDILERHARAILDRLPEPGASLARRVRDLVSAGLEEGTSESGIARALATSRRTLQRRLRDEGTSFVAIVDEVRRVRALELVVDPHVRLVEVAFLTGFAEARAFARAFRRWTGEGPADYRRRRLARGARSDGAPGPDGPRRVL